MQNEINYIINKNLKKEINKEAKLLSIENAKNVRKFFKTFPKYSITPLVRLKNLSDYLGISEIYLKDESKRFGLNAFKVLGGAYAISKYICDALNIDINDASFEMLKSKEIREKLPDITFISATDGNHGRGVAWAARQFGFKAVIYMPKGSAKTRLENIHKENAKAVITDYNYDDTVEYAKKIAKTNNYVMVQDTAWNGYEKIPSWIMQGYSAVIDEIYDQLDENNFKYPTHIILQAGVGSFAGSMLGYVTDRFKDKRPISAIVEPINAACIYESAKNTDGHAHKVYGDLYTIMAGLSCGEPNTVSWEILKSYADIYISCSDDYSAKGMRILGNPLNDDNRVISGESGAVGTGLISSILLDDKFIKLREAFKLDKNSRVLLISTEGDTDPYGYRKIVWDGMCPSYE